MDIAEIKEITNLVNGGCLKKKCSECEYGTKAISNVGTHLQTHLRCKIDAYDVLTEAVKIIEDQEERIAIMEESGENKLNHHEVACIIADLFCDPCACNFNGNDEWLPQHCDFADTCCPNPVGVACWEQYLKHLDKKPKN